jgi:signal transduction histidine kinase
MTAPNKHVPLQRFQSLYWKLSGVFLLILVVLAVAYVFVTTFTAEMYFQEATQRLNAKLGAYLSGHSNPFLAGGVDHDVLRDLFDEVMIINPTVEVYLIDTAGTILAYAAPDSVIHRTSVRMSPIRKFIADGLSTLLLGDDPRDATGEKVFSAAPIMVNGAVRGYYYVILGSEKFHSSVQMLQGSYFVRLGLRTIALTLFGAAIVGLVAFGYATRHLRRTIRAVRRFQSGDRSARIPHSSTPELDELATAFNEMADAIMNQIDEIRTLDTLRRDLVANVSHDLRTPLVSIHGYVETILMKEGQLTDDQRRTYLYAVLNSTERLKKLVEELLELSKLESRQVTPTLEQFSIGELVQDVVQKLRIQAEKQGVGVSMDLPRDLPFVVGDIGLIERVFQNLLDNAIKYTGPSGTINITLRAKETGVQVDIADTGSGIDPEEIPHIFDRFRRGRNTPRDGTVGSGLGLAIVKKILDIHRVQITVTSRPAVGTAFTFVLPFGDQTTRQESQQSLARHSAG